jgi:hypothetical protein
MQVDVDQIGRAIFALGDEVPGPDLLGEGTRYGDLVDRGGCGARGTVHFRLSVFLKMWWSANDELRDEGA